MSDQPKDPSPKEDSTKKAEFIERCRCGNDRHHHMVSPVATYTMWGEIWMTLIGVSANPIRIDFKCRICKESFDFITDPKVLKSYL